MGTSFIKYKGLGFWSRDKYIQNWLNALIAEMEKFPNLEAWQKSLICDWNIQAGVDGGCISLNLDGFLNSEARKDFVLNAANTTLDQHKLISPRTGKLFVELILGKVKTIESSPIDYLD